MRPRNKASASASFLDARVGPRGGGNGAGKAPGYEKGKRGKNKKQGFPELVLDGNPHDV